MAIHLPITLGFAVLGLHPGYPSHPPQRHASVLGLDCSQTGLAKALVNPVVQLAKPLAEILSGMHSWWLSLDVLSHVCCAVWTRVEVGKALYETLHVALDLRPEN